MITIGSNTKIKNSIIGSNSSKKEKQLQQQIDQLTNNWNELEEWLKTNAEEIIEIMEKLTYQECLDKMREIKEGNNERYTN